VQAYNTQIAVEPNFQLIVGQTVTPAANDKQQMTPLVEAIREHPDRNRKKFWRTADIARRETSSTCGRSESKIRGHGEAKARRATGAL